MRKILTMLVAMCMVVSLVACGNSSSNSDRGNDNTQVANNDNQTNESDAATSDNDEHGDNLLVDSDYQNLKASKGFIFESNGDGTCTLTEIGSCTDEEIVIPAESPDGDKVTLIGEYAFYDAEDIKSIIFAGLTMEIDEKAFQSCSFEKLVITGCKLEVGDYAFAYSEDITEILIDNSEIEIGGYAFYDCGDDIKVEIADCIGVLDEKSFQSSYIKELVISECEIEVADYAFSYCEDITAVTIENCTIELGSYAFYDAGDDMGVVFTDNNLTMNDKAFQSSYVITLTITGCETIIGEYAFSYCEDLSNVSIDANNTEIGSYAFYDCTSLANVSIAENSEDDEVVLVIEDKAFQSCGVQNVVVGRGAVEVGDYAFSYCEDLMSVEFMGDSLEVGKYAFYDCPAELVITYQGNTYNGKSIEDVK